MAGNEFYDLLGMAVVSVLLVVFIADFIGNMISFSNRFVNALVTALVFAVLFGAGYYFVDGMEAPMLVVIGAFLVFCSDLVSNMFVFNSRFGNALLTAMISSGVFGWIIWTYWA